MLFQNGLQWYQTVLSTRSNIKYCKMPAGGTELEVKSIECLFKDAVSDPASTVASTKPNSSWD